MFPHDRQASLVLLLLLLLVRHLVIPCRGSRLAHTRGLVELKVGVYSPQASKLLVQPRRHASQALADLQLASHAHKLSPRL